MVGVEVEVEVEVDVERCQTLWYSSLSRAVNMGLYSSFFDLFLERIVVVGSKATIYTLTYWLSKTPSSLPAS